MMSDTLDALDFRFAVILPTALTETSWKKEASKKLQEFGRCRQEAEAYADVLYQFYVVERGFDDQDYAEDPCCAVMDDRAYVVPPSRHKKVPITA